MKENVEDISPDDFGDFAGDLAQDALAIFRINLFLIAVYASVIAILFRSSGNANDILNSPYTIFGLLFWLGSVSVAIIQYRHARNASTAYFRKNPGEVIEDVYPDIIVQNIVASALSSLVAVYGLIVGVWDGVLGGVEVWLPILLFFSSLTAIAIFILILELLGKTFENLGIILDYMQSFLRKISFLVFQNQQDSDSDEED